MKQCNRCLESKQDDAFYSRSDAPDGLDYRCKECEQKRRAARRVTHIDKEREQNRVSAAQRRAENPEHIRGIWRRWRANNPDVACARSAERRRLYPEIAAANTAATPIRRKGFDAHHWSYSEEHYLDVLFLTRSQHAALHELLAYDQPNKRFRLKATGMLLNSKEEHAALVKKGTFIDAPHFELRVIP